MIASTDILGESPYRLKIPPDLSRVADARQWIGGIGRVASLPDDRVFDLQVATSEAVANGIEHAASEIEMTAWVMPDRLLVEITNDGVFRPGTNKEGPWRRRGLGLPLMVSLADQVHVSRLPGGKTQVSLAFLLDRGPAQAATATGPQAAPGRRRVLSWLMLMLPLTLLIVVAFVFWGLGLDAVHDSQAVLTVFNTLFISAACLTVAYLAAVSFLRTNLIAVLLLGTGSMIIGLGFLLVGPLLADRNSFVTVHNTAMLAAGLLCAASGVVAFLLRPPAIKWNAMALLVIAYVVATAFTVIVTILAIEKLLPVFASDGVAYTDVRRVVLFFAVAAFLAAGLFYALLHSRRASGFVLFASVAFACFAVAMGVLLVVEPAQGSPNNWVGRAGQWLGGLYMLAAIYRLQRSASSVIALERSLHEVEDRYRVLVTTSPEAIVVDAGGRYVFANPAAVRLFGEVAGEGIVGEDVRRFLHPDTVQAELARVDQAYAGGTSPPVETTLLRLDGRPFAAEISRSQIRWEGKVAVQTVIRDISERKQAEARLEHDRALLSGIATIFEEALSDRSEKKLGDVCLEVAERITESAIGFISELGPNGKLYDITVSNPGWDACSLTDGHGRRRPAGDFEARGVYGVVLLSGQSLVTNEPSLHPASIGLLPGHPPVDSFLGVPLKKHDEVTGLLAVGNRCGGYGAEQKERLEALAPVVVQAFDRKRGEVALRESEERHRALAEENERLYRQQLNIAETLQLALINIPSQIGRVRLGHLYQSATEAARVGGDFYDVFEVRESQIALLIGDVSGHGIAAARTAALVKDVVHAFTHQSLRTHEVMRRTNKLLLEKGLPGFVTLFLAILDGGTGLVRYSSAGHPEPLLRRASGEVELLVSRSVPLGVFSDATWKQRQAELQLGDLLVLYTDGITEARRDGELFGEARLAEVARRQGVTVEELPALVLEEVIAFSGGMLRDDVALLALSLAGDGPAGGD